MRQKLTLILCLLATLASGQIRQAVQQRQFNKRNFTLTFPITAQFVLSQTATTSAGIYKRDVLVRTLWNNVVKPAGTLSVADVWDGLDDAGNATADTTYTIKLVSNNVQYTWLPVIGNTSDSLTGSTVHHPHQMITNMVQVGAAMYFPVGYNEIGQTHARFLIGKPNQNTTSLRGGGIFGRFVCSDGTIVYHGGQHVSSSDVVSTLITGIVANPTGQDALASFSAGTQNVVMKSGSPYSYSVFDISTGSSDLSGMAVQKSGSLFLATHGSKNELRVFNKTTGASIRTVTMLTPRHIAIQSDSLVWLSAYSPHTGSTTSTTLTGVGYATPKDGAANDIANAFDGIAGKVYRSQGGALNFAGLRLVSPSVITSVRIKPEAGKRYSCRLRGNTGWENILLGTVTISSDSYLTVNVTSPQPLREVTLEWNDGSQIAIDEMEVIGYTYSGSEQVAQYKLNSDGTLGTALRTLSGITEPLAIAVSQDGAVVAVADRQPFNQVKLYNTSTGNLIRTIGRAETYDNPTVYDDKFYFNNTRIFFETDYGTTHCFLAFQSDGSIWIGDYGNMRAQHFTQAGAYIDNVQHMGYSYNCRADPNNPTRVFSDFLEFAVNYTDNSWRFVRNWSKGITVPAVYDDSRMRSVVTLSNGRTYCLYAASFPNNVKEILELDNTAGTRHTGVFTDHISTELYPDGSLVATSDGVTGQAQVFRRRALTGFDSSNNPTWGSYVNLDTSPALSATDPRSTVTKVVTSMRTASGVQVVYNPGKDGGYHFGGIKNGRFVYRTSASTRDDYRGDYPFDGGFDIGNSSNYAGAWAQTIDNYAFWSFIGEGYKGGQVNKFNHYLDNGLMVGQFGVVQQLVRNDGESPAMLAGNANSGTFVKVGSDIHTFHPDEGQHGGIHHWKISNLSSIQVQELTVIKTAITNPPSVTFVDLMTSIPVSATSLSGNVGRWSFTPAFYNNGSGNTWIGQAGITTWRGADRSLKLDARPNAAGATFQGLCDLRVNGSVINSSSWRIAGNLQYPELSESGENFIEVIDAAGLIIARIARPEISNTNLTKVTANGTTLIQGDRSTTMLKLFLTSQPVLIARSGDNVTIQYGPYSATVAPLNPGANIASPATLRVWQASPSDTRGHANVVESLRLYP